MKVKRRVLTRMEVETEPAFPAEMELRYDEKEKLARIEVWNISAALDRDDVGALIAQLERIHVKQCS